MSSFISCTVTEYCYVDHVENRAMGEYVARLVQMKNEHNILVENSKEK
jgi:hypothetical protein